MTELQGCHAAYRRAMLVIVLIAAAHTVDDRHRLWFGLAVAEHDLAVGRSCGVAQTLEFHIGEHVCQPAVSVLRNALAVEQLPAGGQNDVAHFDLFHAVQHGVLDGLHLAVVFADLAPAGFEINAGIFVDHRYARDGLGKRYVNRFAVGQSLLELGWNWWGLLSTNAQQLDCAGRTNGTASTAGNAEFGRFAEGCGYAPPYASAFERQRSDLHYVIAEPHTHPAQDATAFVDKAAGDFVGSCQSHLFADFTNPAGTAGALFAAGAIEPAFAHADIVGQVADHV